MSDEARIERLFMSCPLSVNWCKYKGETYFAGLNWERSIKAKRLMFDLSYCATAYLAGGPPIVEKTVAWETKKFTHIGTATIR